MKIRGAHVLLLCFAVVLTVVGGTIVGRGIFDRSYDSTIWSYLIVGAPLLVLAALLAGFVGKDSRRHPRSRR